MYPDDYPPKIKSYNLVDYPPEIKLHNPLDYFSEINLDNSAKIELCNPGDFILR